MLHTTLAEKLFRLHHDQPYPDAVSCAGMLHGQEQMPGPVKRRE